MAGRSGLETIRRYGVGTGSQKTTAYFVNVYAGYENDGIYDELMKRSTAFLKGRGKGDTEKRLLPFLFIIDDVEKWDTREELEVKPELGRFRIVGILRRQDRSCKEITCSKSGVLDEVLQYQTKFFDPHGLTMWT